ncbi:MAG: 5-formyltetrahydrofolate cyclo-ligase [Pseudomonadota bacterium]
MVIAPIPLIDWKAAFRKKAKTAREQAAERQPDAARFAASAFMSCFAPDAPSRIALYHPKGDELDPWPLAERLMQEGHSVLLPVVVGKKKPLIFRLFEVDKPLVEGPYGIMEPGDQADQLTPDIIVVPLLAIRPDGARLGMGGGFYDRTLEALRAERDLLAIGFGYGAQWMERFPVDAHDQFLDGFVSERGAERFDRRR